MLELLKKVAAAAEAAVGWEPLKELVTGLVSKVTEHGGAVADLVHRVEVLERSAAGQAVVAAVEAVAPAPVAVVVREVTDVVCSEHLDATQTNNGCTSPGCTAPRMVAGQGQAAQGSPPSTGARQ